jgi:hypothetical protein
VFPKFSMCGESFPLTSRMSVVAEVQIDMILLEVSGLVIAEELEVSFKTRGDDGNVRVVGKAVRRLSEIAVLAKSREVVKFVRATVC